MSGSKIWQTERSCMCCQESGEREATVSLFCPKATGDQPKVRKVILKWRHKLISLETRFLIVYSSDSQPGCRDTLWCRELVPGVLQINTVPWSSYLFPHLWMQPTIYITCVVRVPQNKEGWETLVYSNCCHLAPFGSITKRYLKMPKIWQTITRY